MMKLEEEVYNHNLIKSSVKKQNYINSIKTNMNKMNKKVDNIKKIII